MSFDHLKIRERDDKSKMPVDAHYAVMTYDHFQLVTEATLEAMGKAAVQHMLTENAISAITAMLRENPELLEVHWDWDVKRLAHQVSTRIKILEKKK